MIKRILSVFLAICMLLTLLPSAVVAAEVEQYTDMPAWYYADMAKAVGSGSDTKITTVGTKVTASKNTTGVTAGGKVVVGGETVTIKPFTPGGVSSGPRTVTINTGWALRIRKWTEFHPYGGHAGCGGRTANHQSRQH